MAKTYYTINGLFYSYPKMPGKETWVELLTYNDGEEAITKYNELIDHKSNKVTSGEIAKYGYHEYICLMQQKW